MVLIDWHAYLSIPVNWLEKKKGVCLDGEKKKGQNKEMDRKYECVVKWPDGWMMDGLMDGWSDEWIDIGR